MKKRLAILLALTLTISTLGGCSSSNQTTSEATQESSQSESTDSENSEDAEPEAASEEEKEEASTEEEITVTDMSGTEVTIPKHATKIANAWPSSNSVMLLIGAGDLLVGTMQPTINNEWSQLVYPDIVNVPVVTENVEEIIALEPDLYIASDDETAAKVREAGIPAVNLMFSDYDSMKTSFGILGELLGGEYQEKLDQWCTYVDDWKSDITSRLSDVPEEEKPILYYASVQMDAELTSTFASPSICQDWAETSGAVYLNTLAADPSASVLTEEEIFSINPDVIIVGGIQQAAAWETLNNSETWAQTNAMKNDRAYLAPMGMFSWCRFGMESAMMMPWLAQQLYPDRFEDLDINQMVYDFYHDFSGVELTDSQIENMLIGVGPND